jgi:dihydrolipoamide dehydrogenase
VIEFLDRITPGMDADMAKNFQRVLKKQGIKFMLGKKVTAAKALKGSVKLTLAQASDKGEGEGAEETLTADHALLAIGRRPHTQDLGLEAVGVALDGAGRVETDAHFKTNIDGIYAIGDVIAGPMLAHKAEDEGVALAEHLAGKPAHVNYDVIPSVVYTAPEVAWVGRSEEELKEAGIAYNVGKFPFTANGRAKVNGTTDGFVKILADATTDKVLGVHILGAQAGDMIAEAAVAMEFSASAEDIARTCHAHPTLTEAVKEAALAVDNRALHM